MALESFNAYHSYLKSIDPLNDAERGRLFTALLMYSSTGEVPDLRGNERFIFPTMKEQIDRDRAKYGARCAKNRKNIDIRWNTNVSDGIDSYTKDTKDKDKDKEKDKDKDKNKAGDKRAGAFVPPTLEEIEAYCKERNSPVDPKQFYEFFSTPDDHGRTWIDSKGQKVKNWKQKLLTWEKFDTTKKSSNPFLEMLKEDDYEPFGN